MKTGPVPHAGSHQTDVREHQTHRFIFSPTLWWYQCVARCDWNFQHWLCEMLIPRIQDNSTRTTPGGATPLYVPGSLLNTARPRSQWEKLYSTCLGLAEFNLILNSVLHFLSLSCIRQHNHRKSHTCFLNILNAVQAHSHSRCRISPRCLNWPAPIPLEFEVVR